MLADLSFYTRPKSPNLHTVRQRARLPIGEKQLRLKRGASARSTKNNLGFYYSNPIFAKKKRLWCRVSETHLKGADVFLRARVFQIFALPSVF